MTARWGGMAAAPPPIPGAQAGGPPGLSGAAPTQVPSSQSPAPISPSRAPAPPSDGSDMVDQVRQFLGSQSTKATGNMVAAQGIDPDKAATAQALAPVLNLPASAIENDPTYFSNQFTLQANRATVGIDPALQNWLAEDGNNAKLSSDDIPQLGIFGQAVHGWQAATTQDQAAQLEATKASVGLGPQGLDLLSTLKGELARQGAVEAAQKGGWLDGAAEGAGSFLGSVYASAPDIVAGAAGGAAAGLLGFGIGAVPGALAGGEIGFKAHMAISAYGETNDAIEAKSSQVGKPISPIVRQSAALIAGLGTYALAGIGTDALEPAARAFVPSFMKDVVVQAAARPTIARAIMHFGGSVAKAGLTGALVNGGMTLVNALAPQLAEAVSSPDFQTAFNDPATRAQLVHHTVQSIVDGGALFGALDVPMAGASLLGDTLRAHAATEAAPKWDAMQDAAAQSATRKRAPVPFASLVRHYEGHESLFVPGDKVMELYQGIQSHPGAPNDPFDFVPDMKEQLSRAQLSGGDVEMPVDKFTAKLAGSDIERALRPDVRFTPEGFTPREAQDFHAANFAPQDLAGLTDEDAGDVGINQRAQDMEAIKTDMTAQLRRAGYTPDLANQYATLLAERYGARGDDFAQSPLDLYKKDGIQVARADEPRIGPANYTGMDEVIDSLRRGDKPLSDKQLYGPSMLEDLASGTRTRATGPVTGSTARAANGGIKDDGGELAAMDAHLWHRGKPGMRKLVNPQGRTLEEAATYAHDAGYFPDHQDPPEWNEFLDAVRDELHGNKRYGQLTPEGEKKEQFRQSQGELDQFLNEKGIDLKTASNADVKAALEAHFKSGTYEQADKPVAKLSGEEIAPRDVDTKELRAAARKYYDEHLKGTSVHSDALGADVQFRSGRKTFNSSANPDKLRSFAALPDIIRNGRLLDSVPPKDPSIEPSTKAYHFLGASIDLGGVRHNVTLSVREDTSGHLYYNHATENEAPRPADPEDTAFKAGPGENGGKGTYRQDIVHPDDNINLNLAQAAPVGGARGSITLGDGKTIIKAFKSANKSTMLHEFGHLFLHQMMGDADRADAPDHLVADAATVRKWLGLAAGEYPTEAQHEKWARAAETYFMEGKAPSVELRPAFQKFGAWLTRIYGTMVGLDAPINDEIRGVMDRLLATDEAIAEAKHGLAMNPLFKNATDAGMNVGQFAHYSNMVRKQDNAIYEKVLARAMRTERMKTEKSWKAAQEEARPEIETQVKSRPVLQVWTLLSRGKDLLDPDREVMAGKLSTGAVKDILGTAFERFPKGLTTENGMHPDLVAPAYGYASGEAMLRDLVNENVGREDAAAQSGKPLTLNKYISKLVDQGLQDHLEQKFGDPLHDGTIEEVALQAAHNDVSREMLSVELRQLAEQSGQPPPFSVKQIDAWTRSNLADTQIGKATRVGMYRRAEAKAGRDAEAALMAKKPIEAFKAKQRQLVANSFATEAQRLQGEWNKTTAYWRSVAKTPTRAGTAQPYLDQVHGLLDRLGMGVKRDPGELARGLQGKPLDGFLRDAREAGYDLVVPDFLRDGNFNQHYQDLTADQFEATRDAVMSLLRAGRAQEEVTLDGKRVALQDVVDQAKDMMMGMREVALSDRANPGKVKDLESAMFTVASGLRGVDAALVKIEQYLQQLGGKTAATNPFLKYVFDRLKSCQHDENDRRVAMAADYKSIKDKLPKGWGRSLRDQISTPELIEPRTGKPMRMTRDDVIGLMLKMGTESNFDKLCRGYSWRPEDVESVVARYARPEDVAYVNEVHSLFRGLFPDIDAMQRRVTGIGMAKFDDVPRDIPAGHLDGGYYPVDYDASKAKTDRARMNAEGLFSDENYRFATTPKGHTKERTDFAGPMKLGTDRIPYLIGQQVHDLTHREGLMDAQKILSHPDIVKLMKEKSGAEYQRLMHPWLKHIANNSNTDDKSLDVLSNIFRTARISTSAVGIGFRATTVVKHGTTALLNSVKEVGGSDLMHASRDLFGPNGAKFRQFVMDNSGELRHRFETFDRDARASFGSLMGEKNWIQNVERLSYTPVAIADLGSAMPTWMAAFRKEIGAGAEHNEAVAEADRAVRNAHGSGGAMDLAAIQRPTGPFAEIVKCMTMFYGFFDHMYNRGVRQIVLSSASGVRRIVGGDYAGARRDFVDVMSRTLWYVVAPALVEQAAMGALSAAWNNPDENWFDFGASAILNQVSATIPILRDIAAASLEGYSYEASPLEAAGKTIGHSMTDLGRAVGFSDKPVSDRWLQHAIETVGYGTGLPTGQAADAAQYLWDVNDGEADPQTLSDWMSGLMRGPPYKN